MDGPQNASTRSLPSCHGSVTRTSGVPEGNCHFAGEHTSVDFQGYLNGAVETGERAANEILADLK